MTSPSEDSRSRPKPTLSDTGQTREAKRFAKRADALRENLVRRKAALRDRLDASLHDDGAQGEDDKETSSS